MSYSRPNRIDTVPNRRRVACAKAVLAAAQRDARAQRAGRHLAAATAHPGKMSPAAANSTGFRRRSSRARRACSGSISSARAMLGACHQIPPWVITVNPAITQLKAARLLGAAYRLRRQTGYQRFRLHQPGYDAAVAELRAALGEQAFGQAWDEGAALGLDDAMNYALRGRGERGRPSVGWLSLTPAERDVARLIAEGLTNKEIALRLFVSPRTVQTHLTHMYGKLGVTSRVQLARIASRSPPA
jgi:DNA-binding CsgD family transcriptional regulator